MNNVPADLKYTRTHEWLRNLPDGTVEIGITDHAQHELGDLVFAEVPEKGRVLAAGEACAVVEGRVKAASDVYCPIAGEVTAGNPASRRDSGAHQSRMPFGRGWLLRLRPLRRARRVRRSAVGRRVRGSCCAAEDS